MKSKIAYILLLVSSVLCSCNDFISKDITSETVITLSPANNDTLSSYSQLFWWEEIEGSEEYHLQIVKPSFNYIQQLLLDTTIIENKFSFSLQPGTYEWRVRAQNNAGYTSYTVNTITIDSTLDLTSQTIQLISPSNNFTSSTLGNTFHWYAMPFADSYTFQVLTSNNSVIHTSSNIISDSVHYQFTAYGTYKWRVWAQNSSSNSHYMEYVINIQANASSPYTPVNNDTLNNPLVNIAWTRPQGIISDSLLISTDPGFSNIIHYGSHTGTSFNFSALTGQEYYWKLRSKTSQGTMSNYSTAYRFYIEP